MPGPTRRRFLRSSGIAGVLGVAGCLRTSGGGETTTSGVEDSDGDGVIDSEDYAPRDPDVQREGQVETVGEDTTATDEPTPTTATATEATATRPDPGTTATGTPVDGDTFVDSFEDGSTDGWTPVYELTSTFEASRERAADGSWAAAFVEGSVTSNPEWARIGPRTRPERVETAHALANGELYADSYLEWRLGDTTVLRVNYNWSNNFLAVNGTGTEPEDVEQGAVVADLPWPTSERFFRVELAGIDWADNTVGRVLVDGSLEARDVPFFEDADGIDRTVVFIGGNGGNEVFVDATTVPTA